MPFAGAHPFLFVLFRIASVVVGVGAVVFFGRIIWRNTFGGPTR